jgi:hypothetical protein
MTFGVKDLCLRFSVGEHSVLAWIRNGSLKAVDVSRKPGGRPKWRVTQAALEAFEASRTPTPPAPRGRRKKQPPEVVAFYK